MWVSIKLQRKTAVIIFSSGDNFSIPFTGSKVKGKDEKWNSTQNYPKCSVIDTKRETGAIAIQTIINLKILLIILVNMWTDVRWQALDELTPT